MRFKSLNFQYIKKNSPEFKHTTSYAEHIILVIRLKAGSQYYYFMNNK